MPKSLIPVAVMVLCLQFVVSARPAKGPRADSQFIRTQIQTEPGDADLSCNGNYLGKSGQPLTLDAQSLGTVVFIEARKPGYEPCNEPACAALWSAKSPWWPASLPDSVSLPCWAGATAGAPKNSLGASRCWPKSTAATA